MSSTFTDILRLEKQGDGENDSTWGQKANEVFEMIEDAIAGRATVSMPSDANYTLTTNNSAADEARMAMLNIASAGSLTATRDIIVPTKSKLYIVKNATTGAQSIRVKTSGGTGITIPNGKTTFVCCDGTNVVSGVDWLPAIAFDSLPIIDAKGDLIVGTAADTVARKAVSSTNGDTLLADSSASDGWSYGQPARRKNAIINGEPNIWQRGTSFSSIANSTYFSDRWRYLKTVSAVHDVSRSTDVPTVAQAGRLFNYSMLVDCTTADASIGSGDICAVEQVIEGYNWLPLAQRVITLSFWVKATKTGTYCVALRNNASGTPDRCITKEYTVNATDTWEFKTLTFAASPSAGTWDYTNGAGVGVGFVLAAGSTYQTTADAWQTGHYYATANQVNACDSTSNNFRICGVQLEAGSVATEFEQRTFQDELALCQRYYEKSYEQGTDPGANSAATALQMYSTVNSSSTSLSFVVQYKVPKRVVPSFSEFNPVTGTSNSIRNITSGADFSGSVVNGSASCQLFQSNAGGAVANDIVGIHWVANAEL